MANKIWDTFMFRDELDMLQLRCEEMEGLVERHVLVEAPVTHRGVTKPLHYQVNAERYEPWPVTGLAVTGLPHDGDWQREHHQRDAAWGFLDAFAAPGDWVLICDVDEIPSVDLLRQLPQLDASVLAIDMRTCIFAVDWEVKVPLPATCVAAKMHHLRAAGGRLGYVRDLREFYLHRPGGWHLSWLGGPEAQAEKLATATCHVELLDSEEAQHILSGDRYRLGTAGGGLPVEPVEVDENWPRMIRECRCPDSWFRPRETT